MTSSCGIHQFAAGYVMISGLIPSSLDIAAYLTQISCRKIPFGVQPALIS